MRDKEYKRTLTIVTIAQCCGLLAMLLFMTGFMLEYFTALKISNSNALFLLSIPHWAGLILTLPAAYYSDKLSKKFIGNLGHIIMLLGFAFIICIPFAPKNTTFVVALLSILLFGAGSCLFGSNWFALLKPLMPKEKRGHFFGVMRFSWQTVSIFVGFGISVFLAYKNEVSSYQIILIFIFLGILARALIYQKIPEKVVEKNTEDFKTGIRSVFYSKGLVPFISYAFLLSFFTCSTQSIFVLLTKNVLNYSSSQVINLGNVTGIGAAIGCLLGAKIVDKMGTKKVFIVCHISYAIIISCFLLRDFINLDYFILGLIIGFIFGIIAATFGIAITSEIMELLPEKNQSLASAVVRIGLLTPFAMALPAVGIILESNILNENWKLYGKTLTQYDTLLLLESCMLLLLTVTLSVVPSVMKKSIWFPISQGR